MDLIWQVNRPNYNPHPAYPLPDKYSGRAWQDKIQSIRIEMEVSKADALVLTALDEIAWLFNVRGYDLPHTPVLRAYAIITGESIHLYTPRHKILRSVEEHLKMDFCSHANCVKWVQQWYLEIFIFVKRISCFSFGIFINFECTWQYIIQNIIFNWYFYNFIIILIYIYVADGIITLLFGTIYEQCLKLGIQYGCQRDAVTVQVLLWRYSTLYV